MKYNIQIVQRLALYAIPLGIGCILWFVLDFKGLDGQDSHEYLRFSKELHASMTTGTTIGDFFWPKGYPFSGAILGLSGIPIDWCLRLISLGALLGTLFYTKKIIQLLTGKDASLFLVLGAATQVYFVRAGFLVMSDMLCCFFLVLAFYHYFKFVQQARLLNVLYFMLFAAMAFFTRYPTVLLLIIPSVHVGYSLFRTFNFQLRLLLVIIGLFAVGIVSYTNQLFIQESLHHFSSWKLMNAFQLTVQSRDGIEKHTIPNILYIFGNAFHLGFLSIGICLIPFYKRLKKQPFLLASILLYLLLLVGLANQNYRFLVIVHPLVLVFLFPAFDALWDWLSNKRLGILFISGVLLLNTALFYFSFRKMYSVHQNEKEIVIRLKALNDHHPIYSFYVDQSFASYGIQNEVRNLFMKEYYTFDKNALVVFNEALFKEQWKDHRVMQNWNRLKKTSKLDTLVVLETNWIIYRVN